ncbi:MAG: serine/threonine-protein kinase [Lentisphaeria bacterium]
MPSVSDGSNPIAEQLLRSGLLAAPPRPGLLGSIGRYEVERLLGEGGMGQVMLARDPATNYRVAVKVIRPELCGTPEAVRRFLAEARHMYGMSHPNIVPVKEVSDDPARPYFVMPVLDGGTLATRLAHGPPLTDGEQLQIARQIADALAYAHGKGVIHHDLKPHNVLLTREGHAFLADFGLARTLYDDAFLDVQTAACEGTLAYLSPGVAGGKAEDTRCDIYAFGATLYHMITGRPPYEGGSKAEILARIRQEPPRPILAVNPQASPGLARVAERAMARELRDRYAEMADVAADLRRVADQRSSRRSWGRGLVRLWPFAAGVLGLLVAGLAAAWGLNRRHELPVPPPTTTNPTPMPVSFAFSISDWERHWAAVEYAAANTLVEDPLRQHGTVLQVVGNGNYSAAFRKRLPAGTQCLEIEGWMMAHAGKPFPDDASFVQGGPNVGVVDRFHDMAAETLPGFNLDKRDGKLYLNSTTSLERERWYRFRLEYDGASHSYAGFIDGTRVAWGGFDPALALNWVVLGSCSPGYFADVQVTTRPVSMSPAKTVPPAHTKTTADGRLEPREWDDALEVPLVLQRADGGATHAVVLRLKHDQTALLVAVESHWAANFENNLTLAVDGNGDGALCGNPAEPQRDFICQQPAPGGHTGYRAFRVRTTADHAILQPFPAGLAMASGGVQDVRYEFTIPLRLLGEPSQAGQSPFGLQLRLKADADHRHDFWWPPQGTPAAQWPKYLLGR